MSKRYRKMQKKARGKDNKEIQLNTYKAFQNPKEDEAGRNEADGIRHIEPQL